MEEASAALGLEVGARGSVKVFSKSARTWCEGRIEKQTKDRVKVAYQLPLDHSKARPKEWITKELMLHDTDFQTSGKMLQGAEGQLDLDSCDGQCESPTAKRRPQAQTPRAAPQFQLETIPGPSCNSSRFQNTR